MTFTILPPVAEGTDRRLLVAVDFGTTYSGVAWTQTARPNIQTTIIQWPDTSGSLEGATNEKVPTELLYDDSHCKWGYQIPESADRYQWFKLGIDPNQSDDVSHLALAYPDPKSLPASNVKSPEKLAVDYLTCLRQHISEILKLKLGEGVVDTIPIEFIITVPAIWDDAAKYRTRACAKKAGMGENIRIISEPESAVIYALDAMDPHGLQVGDTFVLVDAGGGTVDLISYTIDKLLPSVKVHEAVKGGGDKCGSTFLNRTFRKFLETNFGGHEGWDDDTLDEAMQRFENTTKRKFDGGPDDILIPVPGLANHRDKGVMRGKLTISSATMCGIFEPVMTAITTLVKAQVKMTGKVKAVLLVGGFGQSPYLRKCIKRVIGSVDVLQPPQGWTAVVRGALIKGLSDISPAMSRINIASRIARQTCGIYKSVAYDPNSHDRNHIYWDAYDGSNRKLAMHWFVKKGDTIEEDSPQVTCWYRTRKVSDGPFGIADVQLYYFTHPERDEPLLYPGTDVKRHLMLSANFSTVSLAFIPTKRGKDGKLYYYLSFQIHIAFFSAHTEYSLWYMGKCYGSVEAKYA